MVAPVVPIKGGSPNDPTAVVLATSRKSQELLKAGSRQIATFKRLRDQALWKLLAADTAPILLALLQRHFIDGENRIPQSILYERLQQDLESPSARVTEAADWSIRNDGLATYVISPYTG
jgi:hypothetical protein